MSAGASCRRNARSRYDQWLAMLDAASHAGPDGIKTACRTIMAAHASTRERLPILEEMYGTIFGALPPVRSMLDLACGLNPLAIPWMALAPGAIYKACDIDHEMMAFVEQCLPHFLVQDSPIDGSASVCNLVRETPTDAVDLALVLKALPTLEQLDRDAGVRLLRGLRARAIVVSFPARSLGGRNKQMVTTYGDRFADLAAAEGWTTRRWEFATELVFLVKRKA
jgi:16S rRNA (guanine(1405)-N(7))-methyltransferase